MKGTRRRGFRRGRRWTIGLLMTVVAAVGLACALLRPFAAPTPTGDVLGVGFELHETRLPDGRRVLGLSPKVSVTKRAAAGPRTRQP